MLGALDKHYSVKEIKKLTNNGRKYLVGRVAVDCNELYDGQETFLDALSMHLVGNELLMDITYSVVGGSGSTIVFEVSGDVTEVLRIEDN